MRGIVTILSRAAGRDAAKVRSSAFLNGAVRLAASLLAVTPAAFNSDPLLLGCPNGVVDLRTGSFRPVAHTDMLTVSTRAPYDASAQCPAWLNHLRVLTRTEEDRDAPGDEEMIAYFQDLVGMSLIGEQREHCFVYLYGMGRNGKGVFTDTIREALGEYADLLDQTVLFAQPDAHTTGLTDLQGKRFVSTDELEGRKPINTALLKKLTGGGELKARRMRQDNVKWKMTHTLWLVSNYQPNLGVDSSEGLWERVLIVETGPKIPRQQRVPDAELRGRLRDEGAGILRWAVEGAVRYLERGRLPDTPLRVKMATDSFANQARLMRRYLDEHATVVAGESIELKAVRGMFERWLRDEGVLPPEGITSAYVGQLLRQEGHKVDRGHANKTFVYGLQLSSDAAYEGSSPPW
jgi:putative DNA primase/helicase